MSLSKEKEILKKINYGAFGNTENIQDMKVQTKAIRYVEHYVLWLFFFLFVFDYHFWDDNWSEAIRITSMEVGLYMLIFYSNYQLIIPHFLEKGKLLIYGLSLLVFLLSYIFIIQSTGLGYFIYDGPFWRDVLSMSINFGLFWLLSTLFWYYKNVQKERENQLQLKAEKLETELRFLKNQISPHFIFNTLNNIYALVQQGHANAAPMLAKLSTILRYILYDSAQDQVPLVKEIKTIQEYIQLQLFRKPKSNNVDFYQEGAVNGIQIAPLILLNFIENCFKHSNIDIDEAAWIKISCLIHDRELTFITENSQAKSSLKKEVGGLGNQNIKRQLALKYPNRHTLVTQAEGDLFKVQLTIKL